MSGLKGKIVEKLRIGLVGSGGMANRLANRFSKRGCLVAIASRNRETGKQLAGQYTTHFTDKWSD